MSPNNVSKECGGRAKRKPEDKEDKSEKTKKQETATEATYVVKLPLRLCRSEQSMSLCIM